MRGTEPRGRHRGGGRTRRGEKEESDGGFAGDDVATESQSLSPPSPSTHHRPVVGAKQHRRSAATDVALRRLGPGRHGDGVVRSSRGAGGVSAVFLFFVFHICRRDFEGRVSCIVRSE